MGALAAMCMNSSGVAAARADSILADSSQSAIRKASRDSFQKSAALGGSAEGSRGSHSICRCTVDDG